MQATNKHMTVSDIVRLYLPDLCIRASRPNRWQQAKKKTKKHGSLLYIFFFKIACQAYILHLTRFALMHSNN